MAREPPVRVRPYSPSLKKVR